MPVASHDTGDSFPVQFVWQLPQGDFIRAIFHAEVLELDSQLDRYLLELAALEAGRQEDSRGNARPRDDFSDEYWRMVGALIGKRVYLAYEVEDGRPIRLRLDTLTQEHSFFTRLDSEC